MYLDTFGTYLGYQLARGSAEAKVVKDNQVKASEKTCGKFVIAFVRVAAHCTDSRAEESDGGFYLRQTVAVDMASEGAKTELFAVVPKMWQESKQGKGQMRSKKYPFS